MNAASRTTFETSLEQARRRCGLCVYGYVVMPEHIHLLVNEPERGSLSRFMQSLKQSVARTLALRAADPFWQARYYDFNVWSERKFVEKLRYIYRNPVTRGLVAGPEDWAWSSFPQYSNGEVGRVEIESQRRRGGGSKRVSFRLCGSTRLHSGPAQAELGRGTLVSSYDFDRTRDPSRLFCFTIKEL